MTAPKEDSLFWLSQREPVFPNASRRNVKNAVFIPSCVQRSTMRPGRPLTLRFLAVSGLFPPLSRVFMRERGGRGVSAPAIWNCTVFFTRRRKETFFLPIPRVERLSPSFLFPFRLPASFPPLSRVFLRERGGQGMSAPLLPKPPRFVTRF